jgi:hypothetical protein
MASTIPVLTKERLYKAPARAPEIVIVPPLRFVAIDGRGDPNTSPEYADAVEALYTFSYTLKFAVKKAGGPDRKVAPLEGLWWSSDPADFVAGRKENWNWTMMIAQPDDLTAEQFAATLAAVAAKKDLPGLPRLHLCDYDEGLSAQVLHVGPFSAEGPTIERLHDFLHAAGYTFDAERHKHHEIYLSDVRRAAPEKWRTIVRQPVRPAA